MQRGDVLRVKSTLYLAYAVSRLRCSALYYI